MWTVIMEVQYPLRHPFLLQLLPWQKIDAHLCRTAISFIDMQACIVLFMYEYLVDASDASDAL